MRRTMAMFVAALLVGTGSAQDWPQWRGQSRDAKVTGFKTPTKWPNELTLKWKVAIGDGVATPALSGDKLYAFSRQGSSEIVRCLNVADGKDVWSDKYEVRGADGPAQSFAGPRASPTVSEGKVVIFGARGTLSCFDASSGKLIWRREEKSPLPRFYTSSSPMIVENLCIVQVGGEDDGSIVAFQLADGKQKWRWSEDGTAYSSPMLLTIGNTKAVVAETSSAIVALNLIDGKLLWRTDFSVPGRLGYNAATPMVHGDMIVYSGSGRGTRAVKVTKQGDKLVAKELWRNADIGVQFNTPVVTARGIFGLSERNTLFCIDAETGKTAWTAAAPTATPMGGSPAKGKGKGMMMGRGGYGSIVNAGEFLFALTPVGKLVVFQATDKEYKEVAGYKVAEGGTYAYPVVAKNRIFIKDRDSLALWTLD